LAGRRGRAATAVAFSQKRESIFPRQTFSRKTGCFLRFEEIKASRELVIYLPQHENAPFFTRIEVGTETGIFTLIYFEKEHIMPFVSCREGSQESLNDG